MRVSYVNKQNIKGKKKKTEHTQLRTFYRLLFTHFQGLCSMELDEEEQEKKKRKTLKLNYAVNGT
jgi:hypothetical protein